MNSYPSRSYDEIRIEAEKFLDEYHPSRSLPVPIEHIVEIQIGLEIVPIPGLRDICKTEANAYLNSERTTIYVDEWTMTSVPNRYRFTLAYELGRYRLQGEILEWFNQHVDTVEAWKRWHAELPEQVRRPAMFEAYDFAGILLMPTAPLRSETRKAVAHVRERIRGHGHDPDRVLSTLWSGVARILAPKFEVSTEAMKKRLQLEGLMPKEL